MKLKWAKATDEQCHTYGLPQEKIPYIAFWGENIRCTVSFRSHDNDWFARCLINEDKKIIKKSSFRGTIREAKKFCENAVNGYFTKGIWQKELKDIIEKGCTDSDIEDYIAEHPNLNAKDIWQFTYEIDIPDKCKGCTSVGLYPGMSPCNRCLRNAPSKDYYERRGDYIGPNKNGTEETIRLQKALDILAEHRDEISGDLAHQIWKELKGIE